MPMKKGFQFRAGQTNEPCPPTIPIELPTLPLLLLLGGEEKDKGQRSTRKERGRRALFEATRLDGEGLACGERACL